MGITSSAVDVLYMPTLYMYIIYDVYDVHYIIYSIYL